MHEPFVAYAVSQMPLRKLVSLPRYSPSAPASTSRTKVPAHVESKLERKDGGFRRRIDHFVMNLPDSAIEFLDAFRGILSQRISSTGKDVREDEPVYDRMPTVHCYCFTRELEEEMAKADILQVCTCVLFSLSDSNLTYQQRAEEVLQWKFKSHEPTLFFQFVRSVAPGKNMWRISFQLPREVAFCDTTARPSTS
jgi:tRNA (guanine37-N1)-methyltransferase